MSCIYQGETIFQDNYGYRDSAEKKPVTADTVFHIASLTKSFTGACIHRLQSEGRLSLDDLVQKHLPDIETQNSDLSALATIADLLGHRTGLQRADNIWLRAEGELLIHKHQSCSIFSQLRRQI